MEGAATDLTCEPVTEPVTEPVIEPVNEPAVEIVSAPNANDDNPDTAPRPVRIEGAPRAYRVVDMSDIYGDGHRGMQAARAIHRGDVLHVEAAAAYVTRGLPQEVPDEDAEKAEKVEEEATKKEAKEATKTERRRKQRAHKRRGRRNGVGKVMEAAAAAKDEDGQDNEEATTTTTTTNTPSRAARFFTAGREQCSDELIALPGGMQAALAGMLIRDMPELARYSTQEGSEALFGEISKSMAPPKDVYPLARKAYFPSVPEEEWGLDNFTRLYAVMQTNALSAMLPLSVIAYGMGFFPATALFNHGCAPNAIVTITPGRCVVQALAEIAEGEEIVISYKEMPLDILNDNLTRFVHYEYGIQCDTGCRCSVCRAMDGSDEAPPALHLPEGTPPEEDAFVKSVERDLSKMWVEDTVKRIENDEQLRAYVLGMMRAAGNKLGAACAHLLRERYGHFLIYKSKPDESRSYCPDLAFVLGELYITQTIHVPGQPPADYPWWARVYHLAVRASMFSLAHATEQSLLAMAYASLLAGQERPDTATAEREKDAREFVIHWVTLRALHAALYGHVAYMVVPCRAYPVLEEASVALHPHIANAEREQNLLIAQARASSSAPAPEPAPLAEPAPETEPAPEADLEPCFEDTVPWNYETNEPVLLAE